MKKLVMKYKSPAPDSSEGWEQYSLPIGNSYMGVNVFGIVERERLQVTENSTENPGNLGGLNNFAELYFKFSHNDVSGYERGLDLDNAVAYCEYDFNEVHYRREYFTSYPGKVLVVRLTSSEKGKLDFTLCPEIPFVKDYAKVEGDGGGKTGTVKACNDTVTLSGRMIYYNVRFEGICKVIPEGGVMTNDESTISVNGADSAVIIFALATNYILDESVFLEDDPKKKLKDFDPHEKADSILNEAVEQGYDEILKCHLDDYKSLFGRVSFELEGADNCYSELPTDEMLNAYREGKSIPYLEMLYFQYGRYLLIASSRDGCLPANLQGVWNCHDQSPWGSGYWHNINVQMNYWGAFVTNIAETFKAYVDYNKAFRPASMKYAANYIKSMNPENYKGDDYDYGWTIGTGNYAYMISGPGGHSGPGTGGLTTKLFWDYYDFTRDENILRDITYPALSSMSRFLTKTVRNYDGKYLASFSASPEQMIPGPFASNAKYYQTVGCAFDQQMIYENGADFIKSAELLGIDSEDLKVQKEQIDKYQPVEIGWSGQIKEYSEENFYGEIGEYRHRHISQLMALYPGTLVNSSTPAWIDAAKVSLNERSDDSTGWALAHRLNAWARTGDGNRAYKLYHNLLGLRTLPNLWDTHPPFQIDGNFGGCSGVAEMLIQSHEGKISILPSIPDTWANGCYSGLAARGNFTVSVDWKNKTARKIEIKSGSGIRCVVKYPNISKCKPDEFEYDIISRDEIAFDTKVNGTYIMTDIPEYIKPEAIASLKAEIEDTVKLTWSGNGKLYNIYRAADGSPVYEKIAEGYDNCTYSDSGFDFSAHDIATYRVTAYNPETDAESDGVFTTINHATQLYKERYIHKIRQLGK